MSLRTTSMFKPTENKETENKETENQETENQETKIENIKTVKDVNDVMLSKLKKQGYPKEYDGTYFITHIFKDSDSVTSKKGPNQDTLLTYAMKDKNGKRVMLLTILFQIEEYQKKNNSNYDNKDIDRNTGGDYMKNAKRTTYDFNSSPSTTSAQTAYERERAQQTNDQEVNTSPRSLRSASR